MRLTFTIQRFNPETDQHPHQEEYRLDIGRGMTVLEALIRIKNELDGRLALRYSCRSAICGSCAMQINGTQKLACRTSIRKELERHGRITIAPLPNLPLIKDLVVDMAPFWEKIRSVTPWLTPITHPTKRYGSSGQLRLLPDSYQFHNVDACIMCAACVAACTSHEVSRGFLGPAALAKAARFVADPREPADAKQVRLSALQEADGIWDCTRCNMCVQVCPKDVQPMEAIIRLRRSSLRHGLTTAEGARHITGFVDLVRREGRLNEALMPLKVLGVNLQRVLDVMPLGLRMFLKGKVPLPFGHTIPGIEQVRAIFFRGTTTGSTRLTPMSGTFRFLDDIAMADMAFEAQGDSLSELFEAATEALIQSLADPASVAQTWQQTIELEEPDIGQLLFEWLNRLVYLKDAQAVVFHHATLSLHPTPGQSAWRLHAKLVGAPVDQTTQDLRSDVKGVTKHLYAVTQTGTSWKAWVVLDV